MLRVRIDRSTGRHPLHAASPASVLLAACLGAVSVGLPGGCDDGAADGGDCGCADWQECVADACVPRDGRCATAGDCASGPAWCDAAHECRPGDPCAEVDCGAHGACTPDPADGSPDCVCAEGWAGPPCDACAPGWNRAGATCVDHVVFALPIDRAMVNGPVIGVDHAEGPGTSGLDCRNYADAGFPYCYDEHDGTDLLLDGGFGTMDAGSTPVLAAADGEVIEAHDGEYDRCRADVGTMSVVCGDYGYITPANRVKLRHAGGIETWYWHLKRDSVLVAVGQHVTCGQPLGLVGSSGNSSQPHLHFEVADSSGATIDPYAGVLSQPDSYWVEQDAGDGLPAAACPAP